MNPTIKARIESIRRGEVPEGYKRTKIGIVPNEWITNVTLKSICTINPKTEQLPDEFVYIDLESVVEGMLVCKKIMEKSNAPSRAQRVLQANDVIYQMVRPYQRNNYLFCHESKSYKYVASTGYAQLRAKCYAFLYYLINSDYFCVQVLKKCTGSNYPAINSEDLASISITYPKKEAEQEKIAEILAGQDRVIALKEQLLAEKQKQKKYFMQQLLTGKKRLPGFSGEWKKVLLDELVQISTGNKNTQDQIVNGSYPFFIRSDEVCRINSYSFDGEAILIPGEGKIGEIFHYINGKFDYHQRVYKISDFACNGKYIFYYLQAFFKKRALSMSAKATVDSLRREMLTGMDINLPSLKEQTAIAEILSTADKEIELLKKDIEQEKLKKKSLMQLLLTGIVRVKDV